MNISCAVIKDLLPLYYDGVCSIESNALVEEHLMVCDDCKAELKTMDAALPLSSAEHNLKEAAAIQKLAKRWKKGMWKSVLKGALFTILVIAAFLLILYLFVDFKPMPTS
jgi:predicted anti-sigma-YlaC factor YlaD